MEGATEHQGSVGGFIIILCPLSLEAALTAKSLGKKAMEHFKPEQQIKQIVPQLQVPLKEKVVHKGGSALSQRSPSVVLGWG